MSTTVCRDGTWSGWSRRTTGGMVWIHVAPYWQMASASAFSLWHSEGMQIQPPAMSASWSMMLTSQEYAENCKTRVELSMDRRRCWDLALAQNEECSITTPLGLPVEPDVKTAYAVCLGWVEQDSMAIVDSVSQSRSWPSPILIVLLTGKRYHRREPACVPAGERGLEV